MNVLSLLIPLVPGVVALAAVAIGLRGLHLLRSEAVEGLEVADLVLLRPERRRGVAGGPLFRAADRLVPGLRRLIGPDGVRWLHRQVTLAGKPDGATADTVLRNAAVWILLVSIPLIWSLLTLSLLTAALLVAIVLVMPLARLARQRRVRQERLDRDLPDFLDILSVTVSAGVGFRPALARVAVRYGGPMAEEMTLTLNQIANGASRRAAFTNLRARNDSEALSTFVTAFLQAEELGAPLADTLRQIALDMRRDSAQRMRRKAAQTAPRVSLVTSLVLMPGALILIIVGMYLGSGVSLGSVFGGGG